MKKELKNKKENLIDSIGVTCNKTFELCGAARDKILISRATRFLQAAKEFKKYLKDDL